MTIQEMHQLFRVVGQQMGMQTIRAILPEEIDVFLNMAIDDKIKEVLTNNYINSRDNSLQGQISNNTLLVGLYKTKFVPQIDLDGNHYSSAIEDDNTIMYITALGVNYSGIAKRFNCRIISVDKLYNTLNDFCNKPSYDYPVCIIKKDDSNGRYIIDIYTDNKAPNSIDVVYIKYPNKVSLADSIDCDLPEYSHNEIVQLAVQRYFNSVGSTTHNVE